MGTAGIAGVGLGTGLLAGCINGALVTLGRVPSIVATIGTMTLFRGAAYAVLGDRVLKDYPESFAAFGQEYLAGPISNELALFALFALLFGVFLHRTRWGRTIFAIGANPVASRFAGVPVNHYRFALFALTGLFSGLAAVLLTSRLGSTRPSIAQGWELEIISMVILGGVSVWGGKGSILGVVLAALVFGLVTFGLGLMNIPGIVMSIFTGTLLILVVAVPALVNRPGGNHSTWARPTPSSRWSIRRWARKSGACGGLTTSCRAPRVVSSTSSPSSPGCSSHCVPRRIANVSQSSCPSRTARPPSWSTTRAKCWRHPTMKTFASMK
jgi:ribose/xylose/arabinose/galactoside ABC-type transport system permease subunit